MFHSDRYSPLRRHCTTVTKYNNKAGYSFYIHAPSYISLDFSPFYGYMHEVQGTVVPYLCTRIEHPRQKFQFHIYPARHLPNHHVRLGGKVHFLAQHNARTTVCLHAPPKSWNKYFAFTVYCQTTYAKL